MGLTEKGFVLKTYDEILADQISYAKRLFGDNVNTDSNTVLGKFIRLTTDELLRLYELISDTYFSRFPQFATGIQLDRLGTFAGITRNLATPAQHQIKIKGTKGYTVPNGFLVGTKSGVNFYTAFDITLEEEATEVSVICEKSGIVGNVAVGQITEIINPDANVESITHTKLEIAGEDDETDLNFFNRFKSSIAGAGNTTAAAIVGNVSKVAGVKAVNLIENDTDSEVSGLPARSFQVFVNGEATDNDAIAAAIFDKKPPGVGTHGEISIQVKDAGGYQHTIKFSRTTVVNIGIRMSIKVNNHYPTDGEGRIKAAIVAAMSNSAHDYDLVLSTLYGPVYGIPGVVEITKFEARSKEGNGEWSEWGTGNIETKANQIPQVLAENVSVEVVE